MGNEEAGVARTQYTMNDALGIGSGQNTENGFKNRIMPLVLLSVRWKAFRVKKKSDRIWIYVLTASPV